MRPAGFQRITDLSSAVGLTVPSGATVAVIQADTQNVRWRDDGTDPTATAGIQLVKGGENAIRYDGDLKKIKFIEEAASAALNVSYYA